MATVLEIVRGISQVMTKAYDGALDEDGNPVKIGLRREVDNPIIDSRVMDGFKVAFHGDKLRIKYHSEINLKEVHGAKFESEIEQTISDIASFLKKEYKKVTGKSLTLKPASEPDISVQSMSRIRNWIEAQQDFKIGGIKSVSVDSNLEPEERQAFKKFNALAGTDRVPNVTRKQPARPGLGEVDR